MTNEAESIEIDETNEESGCIESSDDGNIEFHLDSALDAASIVETDHGSNPSGVYSIEKVTDIDAKPRSAYKPNLDDLPDVVTFGEFGAQINVRVRDRIVLEFANQPYRDTTFARVVEIKDNGEIWLWEEDFSKNIVTSRDAIASGKHIAKIAGDHTHSSLRSRRGRSTPAKKVPIYGTKEQVGGMEDSEKTENASQAIRAAQPVGEAAIAALANGEKRRAGRPKGSINKATRDLLMQKGYDLTTMSSDAISQAAYALRHPNGAQNAAGGAVGGEKKRGRPLGWLAEKTKTELRAQGLDPDAMTPEERRDAAKNLRTSSSSRIKTP